MDTDTAMKALERALLERGHDVTRSPTAWMPFDANDEVQLLDATAQGWVIFTFNIRDFQILAQRFQRHAGSGCADRLDTFATESMH